MSLISATKKALGYSEADKSEEIRFEKAVELSIISASGETLFIPDASIKEGHRKEIEFTSNPVEFGAEISDHAIILPQIITVEGRVTNTPLRLGNDSFSKEYDTSVVSLRASGAWEFLTRIANARELVTVRTNLQDYEDMGLKMLEVDQDWQTSQVLDFTAEFKEIFVAETPNTLVETIELQEGVTAQQALPTSQYGNVNFLELSGVETNYLGNNLVFQVGN